MIKIYTDGSCLKNPGGKGACAYIIIERGILLHKKVYKKDCTTNNRMELSAILVAFLFVIENNISGEITLYTDSQYALKGITQWMQKWKLKGWRKKGEDIPNRDLWEKLHAAYEKVKHIELEWVKAHSTNGWNNYVDELCETAYQ
jgi:ribonuclease HI